MAMTKTELAATFREAIGFTANPNAVSLMDRVRALREAGEDEGRILARLNGPAITTLHDEHATPSRGDGGMSKLERRQEAAQRAQRVTADQLADTIAAKVVAQLDAKREALDELERTPIPEPDAAPVVTPMTVCSDGHPPYAHPEGIACLPCAQAAGTVAATTTATPSGVDATSAEWTRACAPPTGGRKLRATQQEVLDLLAPLPLTGLRPGMTVTELGEQLGLEYATITGRVVNLYRSGHLERTRMGGAFVYRLPSHG